MVKKFSIKTILTFFVIWVIGIHSTAYLGLHLFPANNVSNTVHYLDRWSNWDGKSYLNIAEKGYTHSSQYAFFPLYSLLIKPIHILTGNSLFSALLVSYGSFILSLVVLFKLVEIDFKSKLAFKTILYLLAFPFSFFFVATYTESLFLLLAVSTFFFFRKAQTVHWILAGILACATRLVGIALFPALIVESWTEHRNDVYKRLIGVLCIPLGLVAYSAYVYTQTGNYLQFVTVQAANFGRTVPFTYPFKVLLSYIKNLILEPGNRFATRESTIIAIEFIVSCLFLGLIVYCWFRVRRSYAVYAFVAWSIPLMTGMTGSMPRYVLVLFPCFIALAMLGEKKPFIPYLYGAISLLMQGLFVVSFLQGYWVA